MKKTLKIILTSLVSVLLFSFLSCQDEIFSSIRNEVELDDATISGSILSIVRYKDDIYAANGTIYYQPKSVTSKNWIQLPTTLSGIVYDIAADESYLYACSLSFEDDDDGYNVPDARVLWRYDGSSWTRILSVDYSSLISFYLFCTNTPIEANRKAFFKYGSNVYELSDDVSGNSTSTASWTELTSSSYPIVLNNSISSVQSATYLNGNVILSPYRASTSNETENDEATYVYTALGSAIFYSSDGVNWSIVYTNSDDILSIGYSQDYMLLGTDEGIQHVLISNNVPQSATQDFLNNAASALSSYYVIDSLLVVDPSQSEYGTAIFASTEFDGSSSSTSATLENVGLWGYYPAKGEWNRQ